MVDWSPFFWTWDLKGKFPAILDHEKFGREARKVYDDGRRILELGFKEGWLQPKVTWGVFPARSKNESVFFTTKQGEVEVPFMRQQVKKTTDANPYLCLSDYVQPTGDFAGAFIVTAGTKYLEKAAQLEKENDDYTAILVKSVADRVAEALAEWMHLEFRRNMGSAENFTPEELIAEKYRGIRPAPGYAACPDHQLKLDIWKLLSGHTNSVELTESLSMTPPSSVSGFLFHHEQAKYFRVEQIADDQVSQLAQKRGSPTEEKRRWLAFQP